MVEYTAPGIDVSASRNAVMVHLGVIRDEDKLEAFEHILRLAVEQFRHLRAGYSLPVEHGQTRKDGET